MLQVLAHDPYLMVDCLISALVVAFLLVGVPLFYAAVAGFCFMLAGWGCGVSWLKRILAPVLCGGAVLVVLLMLLGIYFGYVTNAISCAILFAAGGLWLITPLIVARYLLRFGLWRSLALMLSVPLAAAGVSAGGWYVFTNVLQWYFLEPSAEIAPVVPQSEL